MIEELTLKNWKSYGESTLYIEPLNFIIGFNASGKSNIFDAFSFLSDISKGVYINEAVKRVRGGERWLLRDGTSSTTLKVKVYDEVSKVDYYYEIEIRKNGLTFEVCREKLERKTSKSCLVLLNTDDKKVAESKLLPLTSYTGKQGRRKPIADVFRDRMPIYQLSTQSLKKEVKEGVAYVLDKLRNIFVLNPMSSLMRDYVPLQHDLEEDASNIAGVIAGLDDNDRKKLQTEIADFVKNLHEKDIMEIWTEKAGRFSTDAMLYCKEKWTGAKELTLDAKGMSDGTLRFIAIVTALLTLPPNTLLLIEEVDNGLHPSRATELVTALKTIGKKRHIDVICTTHNPYLIDALDVDMIPCISYVKRSDENGNSMICLLSNRADLFNLMARGSIGQSMAKGRI